MGQVIVGTRLFHCEQWCSSLWCVLGVCLEPVKKRLQWMLENNTTKSQFVCNDRKSIVAQKQQRCLRKRRKKDSGTQALVIA